MQFNLLTEKWIPVKRRYGRREKIAPWQITDQHACDPIVGLDAPRPDFNGALVQFLIGLVQVTAAPADGDAWKGWFDQPPVPEILKKKFAVYVQAFELSGDGPRFMQDLEDLGGQAWGINRLLIDAPGDNALRNNTDHFIKRGNNLRVCPACCAILLFAMQANAPSGGVGHRTSLRGGGPLTTLVIGSSEDDSSLWRTLWLNIMEQDEFLHTCGNAAKKSPPDIFPWLRATRTSQKNGGIDTRSEDVHPGQMYWGMPRRIRIDFEDVSSGVCSICNASAEKMVHSYQTKNYGVNYTGPWKHPLSPYSHGCDGLPFPVHAQPGGISYRHWLGLVQEDLDGGREPARVVQIFCRRRLLSGGQFRLWVFGYDMDNMKARCWYEATLPVGGQPESARFAFEDQVSGMIRAAADIAGNLHAQVKKAWFKRPGDKKGGTGVINSRFWQETEADFYAARRSLLRVMNDDRGCEAVRRSWHACLCRRALDIFDMLAWNGAVEDVDPKRIVVARRDLIRFNNSRKIKTDHLQLLKHEKEVSYHGGYRNASVRNIISRRPKPAELVA